MRHLKAFYTFHIAAQNSTYSETANKLHITHGAVSKQIKQLESYLNTNLFYKQGRNMRLTKEGELLKQHTELAFNSLEAGITKLKETNTNHLEISCEPTLTMRWLMPRLADFYQQSNLDIRLSTAGGPVDFNTSQLTMAIRRDDFAIPADYTVHTLVDEWVGPVCSPKYWEQMHNRLHDIRLLHTKTRLHAWESWSTHTERPLHLNQSNQYLDHFYFALQAAADGLGAAIGSYPLVEDDIKNGRLIAPFGFIPSGHAYVLLLQSSDLDTKKREFIQWLEQTLSQSIPMESI